MILVKERSKLDKSRKNYLDILKILACFAVIIMHLCVNKEGSMLNWAIFKIFNTIGNFAVPVFVMVSGALLLNKEKKVNYKDIYLKYIPRLLISLLIINIIIYLVNGILNKNLTLYGFVLSSLGVFLYRVPVPYWYIYMIIGLYIVTPILKDLINNGNKRTIEYYLIIFIAYRILCYTILNIPNVELLTKFNEIYHSFQLPLITGYCGYFILGYYLNQLDLSKIKTKYLWIILAIVVLITCSLELIISFNNAQDMNSMTIFSNVFSINIFLIATLLFLSCKKSFKKSSNKIVYNISAKTYGIYLFHVLGLQLLSRVNLSMNNSFIYVVVSTILIFTFSYICTYLMQKIPYIEKYFK